MTKAARKPTNAANPSAVLGFETQVDALVRDAATIAAAQERTKAIRVELDALALVERAALERTGKACKHVAFKGTGKDAAYTFADSYKPLPAHRADDMRAMLGDVYPRLFVRRTVRALRAGAVEAMLALLGDQANEYFEETPVIECCDDFGAVRASVRPALSDATNEALDHVIGEIASAPRLTVK